MSQRPDVPYLEANRQVQNFRRDGTERYVDVIIILISIIVTVIIINIVIISKLHVTMPLCNFP